MTEISYDEEVTLDWDWFAVDIEGSLGHFATAAYRRLPPTVRQDIETLEELIAYFENAPEVGGFKVRPEFERSQTFKSKAERNRRLGSFAGMASRGLCSYDSDRTTPGGYHGVAVPDSPVMFSALPPHIQEKLGRTKASVCFRTAAYISEAETLNW